MGWPKGKPRKPKTDSAPTETREPLKARPKVDMRHKMKARPNWDDYVVADAAENELHIARDSFPDGMDLQWVADTCLGQPLSKERAGFERKGWTPVHQADFDGLYDGRWMAKGADGEINFKGLVLMARPLEYSVMAKRQEARKAGQQVSIKEAALMGGAMPGVMGADHKSALGFNKVSKTVERIDIPKE